jgi:hypothetical protein
VWGAELHSKPSLRERPASLSIKATPDDSVYSQRQPNQRLKLSARSGRLVGNESVLSAAAAGRSLSAIR